MAESAYAAVLKTAGLATMWVQVPLASLLVNREACQGAKKLLLLCIPAVFAVNFSV